MIGDASPANSDHVVPDVTCIGALARWCLTAVPIAVELIRFGIE